MRISTNSVYQDDYPPVVADSYAPENTINSQVLSQQPKFRGVSMRLKALLLAIRSSDIAQKSANHELGHTTNF
jgi:hypothetical protein